jgi:hypothetical protein
LFLVEPRRISGPNVSSHDVKPGIIPERLWRRIYIQGRSPQQAADQAAVPAYNARPAADRLKRR